jgi:hypothetical protein
VGQGFEPRLPVDRLSLDDIDEVLDAAMARCTEKIPAVDGDRM